MHLDIEEKEKLEEDEVTDNDGFSKLGLRPEILKSLEKMGYKEPSPIQKETIPLIMEGKDIIGQAETGSGKTAACGIPIVHKVDVENIEIQALILVPTRELAVQYVEELSKISDKTGVRCFAIYGGFSMPVQLAKLRHGVHVLVGTPGRLIDHLYRGTLHLSSIKTFVIDEADEMLDMGFFKDVELLADCIIGEHQTLLFSATMPPPIKALSETYMTNPSHVVLNRSTVSPKSLKHCYIKSEEVDKTDQLIKLIQGANITQAIIFCKSRTRVMSLFEALKKRLKETDFLHGGLDQAIRNKVMEKFRAGKLKYLIATDLAGRGLDFSGISHVINYNVPENPEAYIHRTGRAARQGREGMAISFMSFRETEYLHNIQNRIKVNVNKFGSENSPVPKPSRKPHSSRRKNHYTRPGQFDRKQKRPHHRHPSNET